MPFGEKAFQKQQGVYYPQAVVQGKPVETETIAKDLTKIFTVSNSDVQAVLGDIAGVMHTRMAQGKSVHIKGLGYFRYARHEGREGFGGLRQAGAGGARAVHTRTGAAVEQDLHPCPCGQR